MEGSLGYIAFARIQGNRPYWCWTTSKRVAERKVAKFQKNIFKRGETKKGFKWPVGPIVIGFFVFVVIGSFLFQIIRTATGSGRA